MYESHLRESESHTERLVWVLPAQCAARLGVNGWLCARAVAQYPQVPDETERPGQRKRSLPMAKYLLLRGGLVLLKTSAHCGLPIFSQVTTNWRAGCRRSASPVRREGQSLPLSLPLSPPQKTVPVGHGVICAVVRTDSMFEVTKFRMERSLNALAASQAMSIEVSQRNTV